MSAVSDLPLIRDMAGGYGLDGATFVAAVRAQAMPKPHTDEELVTCLLIAGEHKLNPLLREVNFLRDEKIGAIQAVVGVDGWITACNRHPQYDGIEFEDNLGSDGKAIAIKASIYRKDRSRPTSVTEYLVECQRDTPTWKAMPNRQLRHRALAQCARVAFGFAGLMSMDEFQQWQESQPRPQPAARQHRAAAATHAPREGFDAAGVPIIDAPQEAAHDDVPVVEIDVGAEVPVDMTFDVVSVSSEATYQLPMTAIEEAQFLANLGEDLSLATGATWQEVVSQYDADLDRLSKGGRLAAEKLIDSGVERMRDADVRKPQRKPKKGKAAEDAHG